MRTVRFVWSDDLALLLRDEGDATTYQLSHWITRPIAYRLPDDEEPLTFARRLFAEESARSGARHAS